MEIIDKYIYGSGNSLDVDVLYIVDELPETISECKDFCLSHKGDNDNVNLATLKDGVIDKCFKGTVDELNNAVLSTYDLHSQTSLLHITRPVERDVYLKCIRAVRAILSHLSRSCHRTVIKEALKGSWEKRLQTLKAISKSEEEIDFDNLNNNMSGRDVMKLIAFQIGQTTALIEGQEFYTKDEISGCFPFLKPYLRRECEDWNILSILLDNFITVLMAMNYKSDGQIVTFNDDESNTFTYDLQTEKLLWKSKLVKYDREVFDS